MHFSYHGVFEILIWIHIATGATGATMFWFAVGSKKGGRIHRLSGKVFTWSLLVTGVVASALATTTLLAPIETHPHLAQHETFSDPALIRAIFGWMMLYLAILTINLVVYGWQCILNKRDHEANRGAFNLFLQALLLAASLNCALRGILAGQMLMTGISMVGFATVATNLWFIYQQRPKPLTWLKEHVKGLVGAGISVYTAFFAFGAVRLFPELALSPQLWAVPLVTGIAIILYHWRKIGMRLPQRERALPAE